MSEVKRIAHNTIFQVIGKTVTMGISVLITSLITRSYGIGGYGAYSLIIGYPALFYIIADFGFNAIATKELSINEKNISNIIGNIIVLRMLISTLVLFIAFFFLLLLPYPPKVKFGVFIGLFTVVTTSLITTGNIGFQVKLRYDLANVASVVGSLIVPVFILLLIYLKRDITLSGFALVLSGIITLFLSFFFLRKLEIRPKISLDLSIAKRFLRDSFPLAIMFIFSQVNFKADSILLSIMPVARGFGMNNLEAVGIYGLAYKVFEVSLIIPTFFMNSVYPIMVRRYSEGKKNLLHIFKRVILSLFIAGVVGGVLGFLLSDVTIDILGGRGFHLSVLALRIFMLSLVIFYLTQPLSWLIVTLGGQKFLPFIYFFAAVLNISLNLVFIPRYSFLASANITWISELFILVLLSFTALRLIKRA